MRKAECSRQTVFLDEANAVKLGDFGLSKALSQASFANTYVGVCISFPRACHVLISIKKNPDAVLHVPRTHARESLRFQIRYLVARVSDLRAVRTQAPIPRGKNTFGAQYMYTVRNPPADGFFPSAHLRDVETAVSHHYHGGTLKRCRGLSRPC